MNNNRNHRLKDDSLRSTFLSQKYIMRACVKVSSLFSSMLILDNLGSFAVAVAVLVQIFNEPFKKIRA